MQFRARMTVVALVLLVPGAAFSDKQEGFQMPQPSHASAYPASETHTNEQVTVAVDPYDIRPKTDLFSIDYKRNGLLPMHLIISNDANSVLLLMKMKVQLVTRTRVAIDPATTADIVRRAGKQNRRGDEAPIQIGPIPIPRGRVRNMKERQKEELERMQFLAKAVEPNSTQSGFVVFDVQGLSNPMAGASLVVTGLRGGNGQELFYFEIPLEKYLTAPQN